MQPPRMSFKTGAVGVQTDAPQSACTFTPVSLAQHLLGCFTERAYRHVTASRRHSAQQFARGLLERACQPELPEEVRDLGVGIAPLHN